MQCYDFPIFLQEGMKLALTELRKDLPWVERLDMTNGPAATSDLLQAETAAEVDVNDDFKRELLL